MGLPLPSILSDVGDCVSLRLYISVFAVLIGSTVGELAILGLPIPPRIMIASIIAFAGFKAFLIALFFQHLKDEPRALSSLVLLGLIGGVILITISLISVLA